MTIIIGHCDQFVNNKLAFVGIMFSYLGHQAAEVFRKTGFSQVKLSESSGIDQSQLSKLLKGRRRWNEE